VIKGMPERLFVRREHKKKTLNAIHLGPSRGYEGKPPSVYIDSTFHENSM
jgi:hypothetical protein